MSLVLSLKDGQDFFIGDAQVTMVRGDEGYSLRCGGESHAVTQFAWAPILQGAASIRLGSSRGVRGLGLVKVMIDAPGLTVLRGDLFRGKGDKCPACNGFKVIEVKERCPSCHGHGCGACVGGVVSVCSQCPDCSEVL